MDIWKQFYFQLMLVDPWQASEAETRLPVYFRPPFTASAKLQTALTKKFLQVYLQSNYDEPIFNVKKPDVEADGVNFRLINDQTMVIL